MSWWIAIGIAYLVLCATGWASVLVLCPGTLAQDQRLNAALAFHPVRMRIGLVLAAIVLCPFFPLVLLHCLISVWLQSRTLRKLHRTYRSVAFQPLHPSKLPEEFQPHVEHFLPILERMGFVPALAAQLKPEPQPVFVQSLLSREGETEASIAWLSGTPAVTFNSVLACGLVVETSCCDAELPDEQIEAINGSRRYWAQMLPPAEDDESLNDAYRRHLDLLADLEAQFHCGTLHLAAEQIPDLKRYANAAFGQAAHDLGWFDNRPLAERPPRGDVRRARGASLPIG